jgi:diaminopimelate epimerase
MRIPYIKAHGARNDFLLTWEEHAPEGDRAAFARAICDRHAGVGADGWIVVEPAIGDAHGAIRLYNSDGSDAEISGNGTRCAAAFLHAEGLAEEEIVIRTGAGLKHLYLLKRDGVSYWFEMDMGAAVFAHEGLTTLTLTRGPVEATILDVGNPQCALIVENFDFDWRAMGKEIERHARFPHRTNVSFLRRVDGHRIEVRFWERGAGETESSGTGSTGAAAAALRHGLVTAPITMETPAGPLAVRAAPDGSDALWLTGPAQLIAEGEFYY